MKYYFLLIFNFFLFIKCQPVEEFLVRGPDSLHTIAINTFLEERRKNPETKDMGENSPIMIKAKQHAIKRFAVQDEKDLSLTVIYLYFFIFITLTFFTYFFTYFSTFFSSST